MTKKTPKPEEASNKHETTPRVTMYMAGPIDFAEGHKQQDWRTQLLKTIVGVDVVGFNPANAFMLSGPAGGNISRFINHLNETARKESDIVVAYLPGHIKTVGTPVEIERSINEGRQVVLITNVPDGKSVIIDGFATNANVLMCRVMCDDPAQGEYLLRFNHAIKSVAQSISSMVTNRTLFRPIEKIQ
jgi:hypothetical protein